VTNRLLSVDEFQQRTRRMYSAWLTCTDSGATTAGCNGCRLPVSVLLLLLLLLLGSALVK